MEQQGTTKLFYAGMKLDTDPRFLKEGEHGVAYNLRFGATQNGNKGARENVPSTVANNFSLPAEISRNIGSYYYPKNNCTYDLYWNSEGFNFISEFNATSGATTILITNLTDTNGVDVLTFTNRRINHIRVMEINTAGEAENVLIFANEDFEPFKLNINKAKSGFYPFYTLAILKLIKAPYLYPIEGAYESDFTKQANYLIGRPLPQLFIQYVYQDDELSVWSLISSIKDIDDLPYRDEYFGVAGNSAYIWQDNRVGYVIPLGTKDVKKVRIGFRERNSGNFFNITEIDKDATFEWSLAFQVTIIPLDEDATPIDTTYTVSIDETPYDTTISDIANKNLFQIHTEIAASLTTQLSGGDFTFTAVNSDNPFDSYVLIRKATEFEFSVADGTIRFIPLSQGIVDNTLAYYFYNNGVYNAISNEDALQPYDAIPFFAGGLELTDNNVIILSNIREGWDNVSIDINLSVSYEDYTLQKYSDNNFSVVAFGSSLWKLVFNSGVNAGDLYVLTYEASGVTYIYTYRFTFPLDAEQAQYAIYCDLYLKIFVNQNIQLAGSTYPDGIVVGGIDPDTTPILIVYKDVKTQRALKRGGVYQYGIVYEDAEARAGATNTSPNANVIIPFYNQSISLGLPRVSWEINNQPPEKAHAYRWVRSKNLLFDYFFQFFAGYSYVENRERFIDLNNLTYYQETSQSTEAYTFESGDRIRFIASPTKPGEIKISVSVPYGYNNMALDTQYTVRFNNEELDPNKVYQFNRYTAKDTGSFKFQYEVAFVQMFYNSVLNPSPGTSSLDFRIYLNKERGGSVTRTLAYSEGVPNNTTWQIGSGPFTISEDDNDVQPGDVFYWTFEISSPTGGTITNADATVTFSVFEVFNLSENIVTDLSPMPTYIDLEIQSAEGMVLNLGEIPFVIVSGTLFEIYRPKKLLETERLRYFDISEAYPIINPGTANRYHGGQIQNQTSILPATGVFESGDIWYKFSNIYQFGADLGNATTGATNDWKDDVTYGIDNIIYYRGFMFRSVQNVNLDHVPIFDNGVLNKDWWSKEMPVAILRESSSFSDFAETDDSADVGRETFVVENSKEQTLTTALRYGDSYVQGSLINGSNNFPLDQIRIYDNFNGDLKRIAYVNRELTLLFQNKVAKVLVNENIIASNRGENTIAQSNQFLSDLIYMRGEYGIGNFANTYQNTSFGEYFFDDIRGAICLLQGQDIVDVGLESQISTYAFNQGLLSRASGSDIISGLNIRDGEYLLTFLPQGQSASTISIDYKSKNSGTFYSFTPHAYGRTGIYLRSYNRVSNTIAWTHSNENLKNTFYGTYYPSTLVIPINEAPKTKKIFEHFKINANSKWYLPTITIPADESYPTGMLSRVKPNNISLYEGTYWANFLRDINTPSQVSELENLFKGRKLRGDYMEITLRNDSTTLAILFSMDVFFALSNQTS